MLARWTCWPAGHVGPLDMFAGLGQAQYVTDYDRGLLIKGFSTMFVLTGQTGNSLQWHFIFQKDGVRLPYHATSTLDQCLDQTGSERVYAPLLETARNFVGWTSSAALRTGKLIIRVMNLSTDWDQTKSRRRPIQQH